MRYYKCTHVHILHCMYILHSAYCTSSNLCQLIESNNHTWEQSKWVDTWVRIMECNNWRVSETLSSLTNGNQNIAIQFFPCTKKQVSSPCLATVGDKIKFPLCTDSPPTCERSCQQKSPKSRPKVASDFRRTLNVIKKVTDLFLSRAKMVCARIQFRPMLQACANGKWRSCNFAY